MYLVWKILALIGRILKKMFFSSDGRYEALNFISTLSTSSAETKLPIDSKFLRKYFLLFKFLYKHILENFKLI